MEYLQLFDQDGNMLNEKINRENKRDIQEGKYYMIMLLIIENENNELLMQLTSKEKDSVYALTGGHVIYGEERIKTCIRETKEEMGLNLKEEDLVSLGLICGKRVLVQVFYLKQNVNINDLVLQESEVESVSWMNLNEIDALIENGNFRETNIKAIELFKEFKKNHEKK